MKERSILTLTILMCAAILCGQTISFSPKGSFASSEVERNGLAGPTDPDSANGILYDANYGGITTGNTISRCEFIATMETAYAGGYGGVFDFDADAAEFGTYTEVVLQTGTTDVDFVPGLNNYPEGGCSTGYKGKECSANFDGTGPSPIDVKDPPLVPPLPFSIGTSSSKEYIGASFLGGQTVFELDFDPADQVSVLGFAFLAYSNFQSYQRGNMDYPNVHARVVWTNGVDPDITQMAVQYTEQNIPLGSQSCDAFFGFKQPAPGYYLDNLLLYEIGNNGRCWIGVDEMGVAVGDGVAVELDTPAAEMPGSGEVTIPVKTDCMYQLQTSTDLSAWTDEGDPVYPTADGGQSWTLTPPTAGGKAFYRVEVP